MEMYNQLMRQFNNSKRGKRLSKTNKANKIYIDKVKGKDVHKTLRFIRFNNAPHIVVR